MHELTKGALDRIMSGEEVESPVFQILGHKKLTSSSSGDRYRLLISDGVKQTSFTMLATQLNHLVTDNILSEYSIVKINRYALSMLNNNGTQRRVMVILYIEVLTPGHEIGRILGNVIPETERQEESSESAAVRPSTNNNASTRQTAQPGNNLNNSTFNGMNTTPISALSPYQNRWVIKARVTNKTAVRTWSNARGDGKFFNMDLIDESGEIRCKAFCEQCDRFYDMIGDGKVYFISRCSLGPANKRFNNLKNNYEMTLNRDSEIIICNDDTDEEIPTLEFNFVPIRSIENMPKDKYIDVLGIVKSLSDVKIWAGRTTNQEHKKREVYIVDENNDMVTLTLWGDQAVDFDGSSNPVLAIKKARIGEFQGGKNVSLVNSSTLKIDPDIPQAHKLRDWYRSVGVNQLSRSISKTSNNGGDTNIPWATFKEVEEQRFGHQDMPNTFTTKATVNFIKAENTLYKACPSGSCKKKVIDQNNGMYKCEKCQRDYPNFTYRLLANVDLVDWSGNQWVTAFNDEGEILLNATAQELGELKDNDDDAYMEKIKATAFKSYIFKLRLRLENFNDENRLKATVVAIQPINYKVYTNYLLNQINDLAAIPN